MKCLGKAVQFGVVSCGRVAVNRFTSRKGSWMEREQRRWCPQRAKARSQLHLKQRWSPPLQTKQDTTAVVLPCNVSAPQLAPMISSSYSHLFVLLAGRYRAWRGSSVIPQFVGSSSLSSPLPPSPFLRSRIHLLAHSARSERGKSYLHVCQNACQSMCTSCVWRAVAFVRAHGDRTPSRGCWEYNRLILFYCHSHAR